MLEACTFIGREALPEGPTNLNIQLYEYGIDHRVRTPGRGTKAGRFVLDAENTGTVAHDLTLVQLPEDFKGSLLEEVRTPPRAAFVALAGLPKREPGERGFFAIDLPPGRYGLICLLSAPDGISYARKGMVAEFAVVG